MNIVVTGGTKGLGLALANQFSKDHRVILISRTTIENGQPNDNILHFKGDVTNIDSLVSIKKTLANSGITVDCLVNNAGLTEIAAPFRPPFLGNQWREIIATNIYGPLNMIEVFLDDLIKSKNGTIINMSSLLAHFPTGFFSVYSSSKAFMSFFSQTLSRMKNKADIRIVEVILPMLDTDMSKNIELKNVKKMSPAVAAREIIRGLNSSKNQILVGDARLLITLQKFIPRLLQKQFDRLSNDYIQTMEIMNNNSPHA